MASLKNFIALRARNVAQETAGPTTVEYAIMLSLIVLVAVAAIASIGMKGAASYSALTSGLPTGS